MKANLMMMKRKADTIISRSTFNSDVQNQRELHVQ